MAYESLKAAINANIRANGMQLITGQVLNGVLNAIVAELGSTYLFGGAATGVPGAPDYPVAYLAGAGTYTYFGGLTVDDGELALLLWSGSAWSKMVVYTATTGDIPEPSDAAPAMDGTAAAGSSDDYSRADHVHPTDTSRQAVIADLATIRSGAAAGATAYQKPSGGIPSSDMAQEVQTSLGKADTAVQPSSLAAVATTGDYDDLQNKPTIPSAATAAPLMDGTAAVGSSAKYAKEDHVHPTDTSRQATLVSGTNIMTINGESILGSGDLTVAGNVFRATYGTTTYNEVYMAIYANKVITVDYNGRTYYIDYERFPNSFEFSSIDSNGVVYYLTLDLDNTWSNATRTLAPKLSPALTGTPTAPTAAAGTSTTQIATTAFVQTAVGGKQDVLVSGTNIKTINNQSLLGSGNITIQGGGGSDIDTVQVTVDANVGTPSATGSVSGSTLSLDFHNLKGETGATGAAGAAAGFGTPTASVDANVGTPSVTVTASGADTAKVFAFAFSNLKGETGATGPQGPAGSDATVTSANIASALGYTPADDSAVEHTSNKVTALSSSSTDTQYPSAKATYDEIHPVVVTTQPVGGMAPNIVYALGTLSGDTTFTLAAAGDANIANHYFWTFDTPSTAPTITWPVGITSWYGGSAPTISASKHYEVSVLNGVAICMEV